MYFIFLLNKSFYVNFFVDIRQINVVKLYNFINFVIIQGMLSWLKYDEGGY